MAEILGLIPARGGSKGIPQKNLYPVMGKPLLHYTLEAAQSSRHITRIMLSSDSAKILAFAAKHGIKDDYLRPPELATDEATTIDVVLHALQWLEKKRKLPDILVLLQPTSPLRTARLIDTAIEQFIGNRYRSLVSVHPMNDHPWKSLELDEKGWRYLAKPEKKNARRQNYPQRYYTINGALYITTPDFLRENGSFVIEGETDLFIMPPTAGIDVDELPDIFLTEAHLRHAAQA